jgi:hypothetical protein
MYIYNVYIYNVYIYIVYIYIYTTLNPCQQPAELTEKGLATLVEWWIIPSLKMVRKPNKGLVWIRKFSISQSQESQVCRVVCYILLYSEICILNIIEYWKILRGFGKHHSFSAQENGFLRFLPSIFPCLAQEQAADLKSEPELDDLQAAWEGLDLGICETYELVMNELSTYPINDHEFNDIQWIFGYSMIFIPIILKTSQRYTILL